MGEFSIYHWLIVLLILLLLFGGRKIPEVMRGLGEGIRVFRDGLTGKEMGKDTKSPADGALQDKKD